MLISIIATCVIFVAYLISLFGWGRVVLVVSGQGHIALPFYTIAVGMSSWVFLGGVLNLVHAAHYPVLLTFPALGILLFAITTRRHPHQIEAALKHPKATLYLLLFLLCIALGAAIYPYYYSLNFIDDLRLYLPRIARGLQLGTTAGDPFSGAGLDSLGGQGFLQSFAAGLGAYQYIVLFDFSFCFLVALGLCVEVHLLLKLRTGRRSSYSS